jgi:type IV secretion system protein VirB10
VSKVEANREVQDDSLPADTSAGEPGAPSLADREFQAQWENPRAQLEGERSIASVNRERSLQSRMSSVLAVGLMSAIGLGLLGFYYRHLLARPANAGQAAESSSKRTAQGEMHLPPLGRIEQPSAPAPAPLVANDRAGLLGEVLGPPPEPPPNPRFAEDATGGDYVASNARTPAQLALARRLAGPVFARESAGPVRSAGQTESGSDTHIYESADSRSGAPTAAGQSDPDGIGNQLRPTATPAVLAKALPTQRLMLPKGAFIDCTLETAIDSTLPGMTTCVMATDSFSADGKVVLLERGTKLVGETRGQVRQGAARVFVLWTQARTPTGVVVPLDSPGTDELGRSGLPGEVDRHFWERFGAAILVSVIDGAIQSAIQSSNDGNSVIVNPSASQSIMTEVLKSTINIPPTVVKQNGDRIQVLVARDLDFRSVYELRAASR